MSFFDELPEPEPPALPERYCEPSWRRVPYESVPTVLPLTRLLHRTDDLALVFDGAVVYRTGLLFSLHAVRHPEAPEGGLGMSDELMGHGRPGRPAAGGIRVGLRHADGARAAVRPGGPGLDEPPPGGEPPAAFLTARSGSGRPDSASSEFWAWPVPTVGNLTFFFSWLAAGLDEVELTLDGNALRTAAAACTEIWPGAVVPEPASDDSGSGSGWSAYC